MIFVPVKTTRDRLAPRVCATGVLAGLAGGVIEVAWIALYGQLAGAEPAGVATGVTRTIFPTLKAAPLTVALGITIHMMLAILLGIVVVLLLRSFWPRLTGTALAPLVVVAILVGVWAVNFTVVLPALNPAFVSLLPYGVSLTSKVLFGAGAALVMHFRGSMNHYVTPTA